MLAVLILPSVDPGRDGDRHQHRERARLARQCRAARPVGDAVRVHHAPPATTAARSRADQRGHAVAGLRPGRGDDAGAFRVPGAGLAIAGSLAGKPKLPASGGTFPDARPAVRRPAGRRHHHPGRAAIPAVASRSARSRNTFAARRQDILKAQRTHHGRHALAEQSRSPSRLFDADDPGPRRRGLRSPSSIPRS